MLKIGSVSISHPWNGLAGSTPIPGIDHPKTKSIAEEKKNSKEVELKSEGTSAQRGAKTVVVV